MRYINTLLEGMHITETYLCKSKAVLISKVGKEYATLTLADKTGTVDGKIWDLTNGAIKAFEAMDYVEIEADVTVFNGTIQLNIKRIAPKPADKVNLADYMPSTDKNVEEMYKEFLDAIATVKNPYLNALLRAFFVNDEKIKSDFCLSSAAKSVHHGFMGGLLEHTLSITKLCRYISANYKIVNHDLLMTAAILHDVGKIRELSKFPANDYTDEGQLLGHIIIGINMIMEKARLIEGFPEEILNQLMHCILAHHGELEYGSPKKPAMVEALALNLVDNLDSKMQIMKEVIDGAVSDATWLGYNRMFESNIRRTIIPNEETNKEQWGNPFLSQE